MAEVGEVYGKWRVTRLYDYEVEGVVVPYAELVNTRNLRVKSRCPVADLPNLEG